MKNEWLKVGTDWAVRSTPNGDIEVIQRITPDDNKAVNRLTIPIMVVRAVVYEYEQAKARAKL
jgi:hypothetical protein